DRPHGDARALGQAPSRAVHDRGIVEALVRESHREPPRSFHRLASDGGAPARDVLRLALRWAHSTIPAVARPDAIDVHAHFLTELQRAAALPGIRGVYLGTNINGRELSDPSFTPIFAACEAKRLPVLLHPLTVIGAGNRLGRYYLNNFLGNPFDTAIAAAHLVFGGVLDRFPKLEVCLPHAGGAMPYLVGRLT